MKKPPESLLNFALALLSAVLLILVFPNPVLHNFGLPWLAPVALTPLLIALAREAAPAVAIPAGRVRRDSCTGSASATGSSSCSKYHGGMGRWGGWGTFVLFCRREGDAPGRVQPAGRGRDANAATRFPPIAALWTGIERTHGTFGFAWLELGNAGIDMPLPMRLAPFAGRLRDFVPVRDDGSDGRGLDSAARPPASCAWLAVVPALLLLPDLPAPNAGAETAVVVQPNMSEDEQWTRASADRDARPADRTISLEAALRHRRAAHHLAGSARAALLLSATPKFREEATNLARDHACLFSVRHRGRDARNGAPLNSAVLLRPDGDLDRSLRQNQPGSVRRIRAAGSSAS